MNQGRMVFDLASPVAAAPDAAAPGARTGLPHSAQNLARPGSVTPQTGQGKVASLISQS